MKNKLSKLIVTSLLMMGASVQAASPQAGAMTVSATVTSGCSLGPNAALNFGIYDPSLASTANTGATLVVTCTAGTAFKLWSTTAIAGRTMTGAIAADVLPYKLYGDSALATELPIATGVDAISGTGTGLPVAVPIYGRILAGHVVPAGSYTQSINLTMTY